MKIKFSLNAIFICIIAFGILLRSYFAFVVRPIGGDSAVFALMARHILELKEFPIYMPLAHYAGAFSSYIGTVLFSLLGVSYNSHIIICLIFSCSYLILGYIISRKVLDTYGVMASCLLMAFPAFWDLYYSLFAGVHSENFLVIPILLLLAIKINIREYANKRNFFFLAGIISGLALWITPAAFSGILTIVTIFLIREDIKKSIGIAGIFVIGFFIGYVPAIIYNFQYPNATFFRMMGRVLDLDRSALSYPGLAGVVWNKILWRFSTVPLSLIRMPNLIAGLESSVLAAVLFIVSLGVTGINFSRNIFKGKGIDGTGVVLIYILWFVLFYTIFVGEYHLRYMLPLYMAAPIIIGRAVSLIKNKGKLAAIILIAVLAGCNIWKDLNQPHIFTAGRYELLSERLTRDGGVTGYSDYDTAYALEFLSGGKAVISPTLLHPVFSDRWPDETGMVNSAVDACYIIDRGRFPGMESALERGLKRLKIKYKKDIIGDFAIYRPFPGRLKPCDILGILRPEINK